MKKLINTVARVRIHLLLLSFVMSFIITPYAAAAPVTGFSAGDIVDDSVFVNYNSMSSDQVQQFLNSKVGACDSNGTQASEYGGGTRAQWGQANYNQSTFVCLKDYVENGKSAAQIIYDAAQQYQINPQVLIVLLQKEQGLVTDTWPLSVQYRSATGYGCPDTAACDSQYYGLTNQVNWSAKMFRAIMNASPTWYTPYILGNNYIAYSPNAACGGSVVNIQNKATQALYNYTPYQPNQAALDAGWGTTSCGAYGNRNFFLYYSDWFGNPSTPTCASMSPTPQVQRLYNTKTYEQYYSNDQCEINRITGDKNSGWQLVGPAFNTTTNSAVAVPVYRLYNAKTGLHFWTASTAESSFIQANLGYSYEGVAFYVVDQSAVSQFPVYRLYNPSTGVHFWTVTLAEANAAVKNAGYRFEGVALYSQ